jgi:4-diphosphocytidyl-2-C-methyl-D-erythritol kinase
MILLAPAKVNLHLKVLGKRRDGYHSIETIFERIALCDKVVLRKSKAVKIFCSDPDVPTDKKGLIYRTINAFKREFSLSEGVEVRILKKIPVAAGLGGGSSDAASCIIGLNKLWRVGADKRRLEKIASALGADIPFFLSDSRFALASGIGDRLEPLGFRKNFWHLIICPPVKLLSGDVYGFYDKRVRRVADKGNIFSNDLEEIVCKKEPPVKKTLDALKKIGASHSMVSGSGPSVFSLFKTRKEAARTRKALIKKLAFPRQKGWKMFIVPTMR